MGRAHRLGWVGLLVALGACESGGDLAIVDDDGGVRPALIDAGTEIPSGQTAADAGQPTNDGGPDAPTACDAAACTPCQTALDCPGEDTACSQRACVGGRCAVELVRAGASAPTQTLNDCQTLLCAADGTIVIARDERDVSVDENPCTADLCGEAGPTHPPLPKGTVCDTAPRRVCNGEGACVECNEAADCPGEDTTCRKRTCNAGVCGTRHETAGTALPQQKAGDCVRRVCDGRGGERSEPDDGDVPDDGNACTADACMAGAPSHTTQGRGTPCELASSGGANPQALAGGRCDAEAKCQPSFTVVRVGRGDEPLSSAATPMFLEERFLDGAVVRTIALPATGRGEPQPGASGNPITVSGLADADGTLSRSVNSRYLMVAGYSAAAGTPHVRPDPTLPRIVARVDATGAVDTSTVLARCAYETDPDTCTSSPLFQGNSRGASSVDGAGVWIAGNGNFGTGGLWWVPYGGGRAIQLVSTSTPASPNNLRSCHPFFGELYCTTDADPPGLWRMNGADGGRLPTQGALATTRLANLAGAYSFVVLDLRADVDGPDTIFVATETAPRGIHRLERQGDAWQEAALLGADGAGYRGLAGIVQDGTVVLIAATSTGAPNHLVRIVLRGNEAPAFTDLGAAATNTVFRGLAPSTRP